MQYGNIHYQLLSHRNVSKYCLFPVPLKQSKQSLRFQFINKLIKTAIKQNAIMSESKGWTPVFSFHFAIVAQESSCCFTWPHYFADRLRVCNGPHGIISCQTANNYKPCLHEAVRTSCEISTTKTLLHLFPMTFTKSKKKQDNSC